MSPRSKTPRSTTVKTVRAQVSRSVEATQPPQRPDTSPPGLAAPQTERPPIEVIRHARVASERYLEWLSLPPDALRQVVADELAAEAALDPQERRIAAMRRLTAWLELDAEDARILARVHDEAAAALPSEAARARYEAERNAILHGLRFDEFTRLVEMVPWLKSSLGLALMGEAVRERAEP